MIQGTCRLWNISISALVFLTVYNILLTLKLMYTPECVKHVHQQPIVKHRPTIKPLPLKCDDNDRTNLASNDPVDLDLHLGRWDNRLKYKLYDNIIVGEKYKILSDFYQTCLATQSSLDKLASLVEVSDHWAGPISLATFAAGEDELNALLLYILFLRQCNASIREKVVFHLAIPKDHKPIRYHVDVTMLYDMDCGDPVGMLQQLVRKLLKMNGKWRKKLLYPQNHLRNLARKNCQSRFVFLTDVDIVPSRGMAEELDIFLQKTKCRQCAYVIPTYELDERVHFPYNKTELLRLANKGLAKPFHYKVFIYNQYATNFSRWQNNFNENQEIHISHPVTNFEFLYEPFYVAPDTVPPHDERFIGYGYTRNTQVYEMFVAGYEFLVLSPIFTCHWGLLSKKPSWREHQNILNRKLFDGFKKEIFAKYNKDPLNMMALRKH